MSISCSLFHLILLLSSFTYSSLAQSNIVKTLPGFSGDLPFTLETGYVKVGEAEQVQLFYYFIESERDAANDPVMLWLTGGPGCSAFSGLIFEIGPLQFNFSATDSDIPKLQQNPFAWTKVASILFVDSPVGTGFSYATSSEAYYSDDYLQSTHLHEFLRKWLNIHSNFAKNSLYISGDSYSGMVVPVIVEDILKGNEIGLRPKLNLKCAMISCNGHFSNVRAHNAMCSRSLQAMNQEIHLVNNPQVLEHKCHYVSPTPSLHNALNEAEFCRNQHYLLAYSWINDDHVREALHIKEWRSRHANTIYRNTSMDKQTKYSN